MVGSTSSGTLPLNHSEAGYFMALEQLCDCDFSSELWQSDKELSAQNYQHLEKHGRTGKASVHPF